MGNLNYCLLSLYNIMDQKGHRGGGHENQDVEIDVPGTSCGNRNRVKCKNSNQNNLFSMNIGYATGTVN